MLDYRQHDGGRQEAGYKGSAGDCATRAIAIATGTPYRVVYRGLAELSREMTGGMDMSPRDGVWLPVFHEYMLREGWCHTLTKGAYMTADALPFGLVLVVLNRHYVAVRDHEVLDAWDSRKSKRTKCGAPKMLGFYQP